jgi:subtilisin family serine protease
MRVLAAILAIVAVALCADFAIYFKEQVNFEQLKDPITLKSLKSMTFSEKGRLVTHELQRVAEYTQKPIKSLLNRKGYSFKSYWITNMIIVENADSEIIKELAQREEVEKIERLSPFRIPLEEPTPAISTSAGPEWNIEFVNAPKAWSKGITGKGIVVGILDTGSVPHVDTKTKYRGYSESGNMDHNYNWFDGVRGQSCKNAPCDQHGHGSHVTGTVLGSNDQEQVGVAIDAKWIACRAFATGSATTQDILNCFQWFLAPTKLDGSSPDPDKRPHIVSNSWGSTQRTTAFDKAIQALHAAGTICVFAAGNSGSRCSSVGWPGANEEVLTVGATAYQQKTIVYFSSRGPVPGASHTKPNVVAPGERIRSISPRGTGYATMSGTSMATPCVSGSVALLLSARHDLIGDIEGIKKFMQDNAEPIKTKDCSSPQDHPNNVYGWGLIDNSKL